MKIALVHDWLTGMRGGEKVLEVFCELLPGADLFTLVHVPGTVSSLIEKRKITTSYLQKIPGISTRYRYALPLMPHAIESLDLSGYDLVISTSHCVAKGCKVNPVALHISCCFTPMRYIWDQYENYFGAQSSASAPVRLAMGAIRGRLQDWDRKSSQSVTEFIAISKFVADRIQKNYSRGSTVIYPHADTDFFTPAQKSQSSPGFYLIVSAFAPYKKIDIAVQAFNRMKLPLKIIGDGQDEKRLKSLAGNNIEFLGWRSNEELRSHYRGCRALIFPGIEDYGIVPLEAMACGSPVIAYGAGGALETMAENKTGIFFKEQSPEALAAAVKQFETRSWDPEAIRGHALKFSRGTYRAQIRQFLLDHTRSRFDLNPYIS